MQHMARWTLMSLLVFCLAAAAAADVPDSINVQGILTDSTGAPIIGEVDVVFRIYDAETGGSERYAEDQTIIADEFGRFDVFIGGGARALHSLALGPVTFRSSSGFLEIQVVGYPAMPRVPFVTVPYAYRVATINGATGGTITGNIYIDSTYRYYSIPAAEWLVEGYPSPDVLKLAGEMLINSSDCYAALHLPDGAVIKSVVAYIKNASGDTYPGDFMLHRAQMMTDQWIVLGSDSESFLPLALDSLCIDSIDHNVIDNSNYVYWLYLNVSSYGDPISLLGARVEYVITRPLP